MSMKDRPPQKKAERTDEQTEEVPRAGFPFPRPDFNPLYASPQELRKYGLPQMPDRVKQPALQKAWLRLFEQPLTFERPGIEERVRLAIVEQPEIRQILPDISRFERSPNWCGASIVPRDGNQFVLMFGEWKVPTPSLPPPPERGPSGQKNEYHCVAWIGLDGNRRYLNSSLPQTGTEQVLTVDAKGNLSRTYTAWFQWWARNQVKITHKKLSAITIQAGMSVMAMIWVINPHHVVVVFRTYAPLNQITILVEPTPEVYLRPPQETPRTRPSISGATAEWIVERPETLVLYGATLERFPKYSPVRFRHCVAGTAPAAGLPTSEETLESPRFFRMFEVPNDVRPRTRFISMPERDTTTSVLVHYGGFSG
jgi:hypothetical protein